MKERNLQSIRKRVFDIIQIGKYKDYVSRAFDVFIALVIIANITVGICASDLDGRLLLSE